MTATQIGNNNIANSIQKKDNISMVTKLKAFWKNINGFKTISGVTLWGFSSLLQYLGILTIDQANTITDISYGIIGIGGTHKLIKLIQLVKSS